MTINDVSFEINRLKQRLEITLNKTYNHEHGYHGSHKGICYHCGTTDETGACKEAKENAIKALKECISKTIKLRDALKSVDTKNRSVIMKYLRI